MKSTDENIKGLSEAVLNDARNDAEQILADAKAKAEEIRKQAGVQAAAERAKILEKASLEAERLRSQAVSTTQLKARTIELEQREKLLNEVFEKAAQKISAADKGADYEKTATMLLREALTQLGAEAAVVRADKTTQKFLSTAALEKLSKELKVKIKLGESLKEGLGVVVETEDGHRQYDNTLETRLKRMRDALRSPVYHILTGESK
jgi:V/A-type H+/Na+-transporting ATPase subunit E